MKFFHRAAPAPEPLSLPNLRLLADPAAASWLVRSMTTFAKSVASFLPGDFEAYARIHHPFGADTGAGPTRSWREALAGEELSSLDPATAEALAYRGADCGQALVGSLPGALIPPLLEHLQPATTTPGSCFFALWEGFGDLDLPVEPTLELPQRRYHLFAGPLEGALTNLSTAFRHRSANLWWPEDHAWCVATEVDSAWTWVGGAAACIDRLLADGRLEAIRTSAKERW